MKYVTFEKGVFSVAAFIATIIALNKEKPFGEASLTNIFLSFGVAVFMLVIFSTQETFTFKRAYVWIFGVGVLAGVLIWILFHQLWLAAILVFIVFGVVNLFVQRRRARESDEYGRHSRT